MPCHTRPLLGRPVPPPQFASLASRNKLRSIARSEGDRVDGLLVAGVAFDGSRLHVPNPHEAIITCRSQGLSIRRECEIRHWLAVTPKDAPLSCGGVPEDDLVVRAPTCHGLVVGRHPVISDAVPRSVSGYGDTASSKYLPPGRSYRAATSIGRTGYEPIRGPWRTRPLTESQSPETPQRWAGYPLKSGATRRSVSSTCTVLGSRAPNRPRNTAYARRNHRTASFRSPADASTIPMLAYHTATSGLSNP